MPLAAVNGAQLHYETRGTGPPVLCIQGATGDGGSFDRMADLLADEVTIITYDRRGNSRSPVPAGWMKTSVEEQAEDAAGLTCDRSPPRLPPGQRGRAVLITSKARAAVSSGG